MGKVSKVRKLSPVEDKPVDSSRDVRVEKPALWYEDVGVRVDVFAGEAAKGCIDPILSAAINAVLQAVEEAGLFIQVSSRHGAADGRNASFSCAAAREETIERIVEGRSFRVGGSEWVPQDEPVEGR